jgi:hypothetical protein
MDEKELSVTMNFDPQGRLLKMFFNCGNDHEEQVLRHALLRLLRHSHR